MDGAQLLQRVVRLAGFESDEHARRATRATLRALGEALRDPGRRALADELPAEFADALPAGRFDEGITLERFYEHVRRSEHTQPGFALEHAQAACEALAAGMSEAALRRVRDALPEDIAPLFSVRVRSSMAPEATAIPERVVGAGTRLSDARPGSRHPLSEGRADRTHAGSLARAANPHAETKLSSSAGTTQERAKRTLAEGRGR